MEFEIGNWLMNHRGEYGLSSSGMYGVLNLDKYFNNYELKEEDDLKGEIASLHNTEKDNIVLTHGATEAFSMVMFYLKNRYNSYNVNYPEYELIYKTPELLGYNSGNDIFAGSNPNNPSGNLISIDNENKINVIDETFMEFYQDLDRISYNNGFIVNTFTKLYAGDDLRLGYIITPNREDAERLDGYKGLLTEGISRINISVGYKILKNNDNIVNYVRDIIRKNNGILMKKKDKLKFYKNIEPLNVPVSFMDYSNYTDMDSDNLSEELSRRGIIAAPSRFFGLNGTYLRICTTRLNFEESYSRLINALKNIKN